MKHNRIMEEHPNTIQLVNSHINESSIPLCSTFESFEKSYEFRFLLTSENQQKLVISRK